MRFTVRFGTVALLVLSVVALAALGASLAAVETATGAPLISTTWRADGSTIWDHAGPGNYPGFTPTTTISCTGAEATTCYVAIHANGVLPNGRTSTPGILYLGEATDFMSSEFRSTDGGRTWHELVLPEQAFVSSAFSCPTARRCAVGALVGKRSFTKGTPVVLTTADGGRSWAVHRLPASAGLVRELDCTTAVDCVALTWTRSATRIDGMVAFAGANDTFPSEIYSTRDGGRSWSVLRLPPAPAGDVYSLGSISCPATRRCVLTGIRRHIERVPGTYTTINHAGVYRDTGEVTVVLTMGPGLRIRGPVVHRSGPVACISATRCTMITRSTVQSTVYETSTGARTWTKVAKGPAPGWPARDIQCVSATSCVLLATSMTAVTNDGGRHWTLTKTKTLSTVSCASSGLCVALQAVSVKDVKAPQLPTGAVGGARVLTNARR